MPEVDLTPVLAIGFVAVFALLSRGGDA